MTPDYKPLIIAGQNSGTPVQLNKVYAQFYKNLESIARSGNYWAQQIIYDLQSLSSGHIKPNVFVKPTPTGAGYTDFEMLLPGCRASVMKCSNGRYMVYDIPMDVNYPLLHQQSQRSGLKPGLHHVHKSTNGWVPRFKPDGRISTNNRPAVAISDGGSTLRRAAANCRAHLEDSTLIGTGSLDDNGFDMHYTPGKKIGGLLQINQALNAATDASLYESAILLARSMEMAQNQEKIHWLTQGGGSGIFTQALHILKGRGITFSGKGHTVRFCHPTTSYVKAQALAMDLGIKFERKNHDINSLNLDQVVGGLNFTGDFIAAYQRLKRDPEYTRLNCGVDALKGIARNWQAITVASGCSAALSAAVSAGGTAAVFPAIIAAATAMSGLGNTLFQSWLPERHRQIKEKL